MLSCPVWYVLKGNTSDLTSLRLPRIVLAPTTTAATRMTTLVKTLVAWLVAYYLVSYLDSRAMIPSTIRQLPLLFKPSSASCPGRSIERLKRSRHHIERTVTGLRARLHTVSPLPIPKHPYEKWGKEPCTPAPPSPPPYGSQSVILSTLLSTPATH